MNRAIEILKDRLAENNEMYDEHGSGFQPEIVGDIKAENKSIELALEILEREQGSERAFTNFYVGGDCNTFGDEYSSYDEAFNSRNAFSNNYKETVEIIRFKGK